MSFSDLSKNFEKDVEHVYGEAHSSRDSVKRARRIIIKVHTCPEASQEASVPASQAPA